MKKTVLILLIITVSLKLFALDIVKLKPLREGEKLRLNYNKMILNVEKITSEKVETYYTCKSYWGAWQISADKRKVLIYEEGMHEIYLLDGNKGTIEYKGHLEHSGFPSADFKYIITEKMVPEDQMLNFVILDLDTMKELYNFPWVSQKENLIKYGWIFFDYYRSLDLKYDFVIYVSGQETIDALGHAYLNATTRDFKEVIYPSLKPIPQTTPYECGWE